MLTVILGAGASYDSIGAIPAPNVARTPQEGWDYQGRPPLASQLFGVQFAGLLDDFPSMRVVYDELSRLGTGEADPTIEETLEAFQKEAESGADAQRWRHMGAIRFYLRRAIGMCANWSGNTHGITNYTRLVGQVRRWADQSKPRQSATFITFNYDTLLDDACYEVGLRKQDLASYVGEQFALAKFHGSVNWSDPIANAAELFGGRLPPVAEVIRRFAEVKTTGVVRLASGTEINTTEGDLAEALPGLAVPLVTKASAYCPEAQLGRMDDALADCEKLLVIGWRGAEDHFWRRVKRRADTPQVLVVTGGPDLGSRLGDGLENHVRIPRSRVTISGGGFSQFMAGTALHDFLSS
jgi:hypothetical protein